MKLKGITDAGMRRLAQGWQRAEDAGYIDMSDYGGPDEDLRRQLNSIIETLVAFREEFDDDYLTELGRTQGEAAARAVVEAVWPSLDAVYAFLELGEG